METEKLLDYDLQKEGETIKGKIHIDICKEVDLPKICLEKFTNAHAYFLSEDERKCELILSSNREFQTKKALLEKDPVSGFIILPKDNPI